MYYLFEQSDSLNNPVECFIFDVAKEEFPVRPHWHYFVEIIYLLEGQAEMQCGGKSYILNEGDMILFHPKAVHAIYATDSCPLRYGVLKFDINKFSTSPAYAPKLRSIFKCAEKNKMSIFFSSEETEKMGCGNLINECIEETRHFRYGYDLIVRAAIYKLLMNIIRCWLETGLIIDNSLYPVESETDIDNVTEYIDAHLGENLRVAEIARKCGMSYSGFAKKFREVYGTSCKEYLDRIRVYKVEELLLFTDFDLNYVSQECGFSDCSHMIKSFRSIKGITPKQFRLEKRKT